MSVTRVIDSSGDLVGITMISTNQHQFNLIINQGNLKHAYEILNTVGFTAVGYS